jgi:hypothetical protein
MEHHTHCIPKHGASYTQHPHPQTWSIIHTATPNMEHHTHSIPKHGASYTQHPHPQTWSIIHKASSSPNMEHHTHNIPKHGASYTQHPHPQTWINKYIIIKVYYLYSSYIQNVARGKIEQSLLCPIISHQTTRFLRKIHYLSRSAILCNKLHIIIKTLK